MDLFSKFKKDYFNYLISIILPSFISALSIPVFKNLLGAKGYGKFSIWFNAILIATAILSGWIAQSIIRFFPASTNKRSFSRQAIILSLKTQGIFFVPVFIVAFYVGHDLLLALLTSLVLFATSLQFTILPIIQSSFLSRKIILSEIIRVTTYVGGAVLLLKFSGLSYLYSLFIAVFSSYLFSLFFLIKKALQFFKEEDFELNTTLEKILLFKKFFKYGAPLSLWFLFSYLISYADKLFMFKYEGAEAQGNYQAIFDLLFRGITLIISPVVTSLFPILTSAYERGNKTEIRKFIKKIIIFEISGFTVASILYWWFGADLLRLILKTPNTETFRLMGFIVICGTFIWQLAILAQKRFELKLNSFFLLAMVVIAFTIQLIFYFLFKSNNNILVYPAGFLLSAFVYLLLISFSELISFSRSFSRKPKFINLKM
ncbi:MAG: oligosaccharide flippase family protein [Bacteroidota bacterium]|nr:oligosaccharide flippase family protein [Bacteroidota bacterium]